MPKTYQIYAVDGEYIVTAGDLAQSLRGDLSDILSLWSRLERFVREQDIDESIDASHPLARITATDDLIDTVEACRLAEEGGRPISDRTLLYNLTGGNVPGAYKTGGRWTLSRAQFLQWLRVRG